MNTSWILYLIRLSVFLSTVDVDSSRRSSLGGEELYERDREVASVLERSLFRREMGEVREKKIFLFPP
jgi:hypothetical protein